ncbi:GntR family transcriptional regulator protein (plasmid) [Rhizobium sp. CIAT894]|uniref:FadR/GntR family transcriptional regulator n=1 Tax=Rhizobium sp. CIAT894 TaxID=2020312 RepID=UPI000A1F96BB|nr:FadR/GntR family transcriptional regulator [Rhizobium sp. CIAT894]ARM92273.1 GntR family transcriptional regulator protein [Rhizobium sp. CIAT894]
MSATKKNTLTLKTEKALRERILDDSIKVGDKLPTEKALALEFGVSRTVIREAVAALRADGLLEAKHGVGVFVSQKAEPEANSQQGVGNLHFSASMLDILELRMAVEVHAAGLAAARRSWAQEAKIWEAADRFRAALADNAPTEEADWTFHRSISEATNNEAFIEFFDRLGLSILPRRALEGAKRGTLITHQYLEKSVGEHHAICEAIAHQDVEAARDAMKNHIGRSQMRYRGLMVQARKTTEEQDNTLDDAT